MPQQCHSGMGTCPPLSPSPSALAGLLGLLVLLHLSSADPALALGAHVGWQRVKGTQLLEGEAAAVAQQGDVGSFALNPCYWLLPDQRGLQSQLLLPKRVQAAEAEEAALGLAAGLGRLWAQLLPSPVHSADGGGELLLQPQQEALDQLVDAELLPALWEQRGEQGSTGAPVPALGTQRGLPTTGPPTLVKRGGTVTVGTLKKRL